MDLTRVVNNFIEEADCLAIISHLEQLISTGDVIIRPDKRIGVINRKDEVFDLLVEKYKNKTIKMFNDEFRYFSGYIATKYVKGVGMATHTDSKVGVNGLSINII